MSESSAFGSIVVCMSSVSLSEEGPQKLQQQLQENEKKRKNIQGDNTIRREELLQFCRLADKGETQ